MAKYERFVVCADTHGDKANPTAVAAFFEFMVFWKPKHRIHLGDIFNLSCMRSGASDDEQLGLDLQADLDAGSDFLKRMKPTIILLGNHDHRAIRQMRSPHGKTRMLAEAIWAEMEDSMCGVKPLPYNKRKGVGRFGDQSLIHGYASGITATRKQTLVYGNVWCGHNHFVDHTTTERFDRAEGRCIGTLAELDQDYNETHLATLKQEHGFLYGYLFNSGKTMSFQAKPCDGVWIFPSEMKEAKCEG